MTRYAWLALALLVALGGVYAFGRHDGKEREQQAQAARVEAARVKLAKVETKAANISTDVATKAEARQVEIRTVTRTIVQKVTEYVPAKADAACVVPRGFVVLHDAAARGVPPLPGTASGADEPSDVPLSSVASTVADNYGACHADQARLGDLQSWLRLQAANRKALP